MSGAKVLIDIIGRDGASRAFDTAAASCERAATRMGKVNATLTKTGAAMTKGLTVPIIAVGAASAKVAIDFQKNMTLLETAGGETVKKVQVIGKGITKVAVDTGTSLGQLGDGMYVVAKAGAQRWSAVDQLKVLRAASQGAKAENVDLHTSVSALTSVMMSYGLGAGKAVAVENEIIRASGLAKVTMQDFAGSLSNVVPVASALHISFAQVAGAIATMTQHGESADQASQNLNNLITNLSGQNNVAAASMQQLGINTVSLRKNLGKMGLTGALDLVEKALAKNTKGGLVVVDTFKHAQLATKSLGTMLGTMHGNLKTNSEGLVKGSVSIKEYTKFAKSLGGQAGASALQFLALTKSSLGFNNLLKSGNGNVQTAATMFQKMLGGMTGMRAALMLTGTSMKQNKDNVAAIAKAYRSAGVDVLGWSKTQGTLAVKLDKAKANLQVLGLEIGTAVIPMLSKVTGKVIGAVQWFEHLSSGWKSLIGHSLLVVAALGPVLSILGRVSRAAQLLYNGGAKLAGWAVAGVTAASRFVRGMALAEVSIETMNSKAWAAGFKMRGAFAAIGTGAMNAGRYVVTAFKNAGSALAGIGPAMKSAEGFGGKLRAIGSGAAGAGAALGPMLGVMAGVGGVLAAADYAWNDYQKQQAQARAEVQSLTSAIEADNGALGSNARLAVVNVLAQRGMLTAAQHLGISTKTLTDAYLGNKDAAQAMNTQIAVVAGGMATGAYGSSKYRADAVLLSQTFGQVGDEVNAAKDKAAAFKEAMGPTAQAINATATASDRLASSLQNLDGGALNSAQAAVSFQQSLGSLRSSIQQNGHALKGNTAQALANRSAVISALQAAEQHAQALKDQGKGAGAVKAALTGDIDALIATAKHAHMNIPAFKALLASMHLLPKQITTKIDADTKPVMTKGQAVQKALDNIRQKKLIDIGADSGKGIFSVKVLQTEIDMIRQGKVPGVTADTAAGRALIAELQTQIDNMHGNDVTIGVHYVAGRRPGGLGPGQVPQASGTLGAFGTKTIPPNSVFTVGEGASHTWEGGVSDSQGRVSIFSNAQSKAMGFRAPTAYAKGTGRKVKGAGDTTAVSMAIGGIGATPTSKFDISTTAGGYAAVESEIAHAWAVFRRELRKGMSSKSAQAFRDELNRYAALAQKQLSNLKVKIKGADVSALRSAMTKTVQDAQNAFAQMFADARTAGVRNLAPLARIQRKVIADMQWRDRIDARLGSAPTRPTAYDNLATATSNYSNEHGAVKSAVMGSFDIMSAGASAQVYNDRAPAPTTGKSILAALKAAVAKAKTFGTVLKKLAKMGLAPTLLSQLAQAGPQALDQANALASSGAGTIHDITAQYAQLDKIAGAAGTTSADAMYGAGVNSARKVVNGLLSQRKAVVRAMQSLGQDAAKALDEALDPHKAKGHGHAHGGTHHGHGGRKFHGVTVHGGIHIHQQKDPVATANALSRRLAALGA